MRIILKILKFIVLFLSLNVQLLFSQGVDSKNLLSKIRSQYSAIITSKVKNLKKIEFDESIKVSENDIGESPSTSKLKITVYHDSKKAYLLRVYNLSDEGGAFSHHINEVLFWDGKPFFYYDKNYMSWEENLTETRLYINDSKVIQKLTKKSELHWSKLPENFYDCQTKLPNTKENPSIKDFDVVISFVNSYKTYIDKALNK